MSPRVSALPNHERITFRKLYITLAPESEFRRVSSSLHHQKLCKISGEPPFHMRAIWRSRASRIHGTLASLRQHRDADTTTTTICGLSDYSITIGYRSDCFTVDSEKLSSCSQEKKNREFSSLTYDVVRLLHHGRLRRIHNGADATTRDCVLAASYSHPRPKNVVPGETR